MTLLEQLLDVAAAYQAGYGRSEVAVSKDLFNDGQKLGQMRAGKADCSTRVYERALQMAADYWPGDDTPWPAGVKRPRVSPMPENARG